jgi:hypothetical protein
VCYNPRPFVASDRAAVGTNRTASKPLASTAVEQLQIAPLGAGDLIDRTVRLYRRHFMALIRASAPPVVIGAVGAVLWSVGMGAFGATTSDARLLLYGGMALAGLFIRLVGLLALLIVLGGASRNLVMHLLWGEPVTARLVYRSVRARFWGLLGAALSMCFYLLVMLGLVVIGAYVALLVIALAGFLLGPTTSPWVMVSLVLGVLLVCLLGGTWLFFLTGARAAYVPQVMMVEGRDVFDAIRRSAALARGNVRRLMAMALFTLVAGAAVLLLFLYPLWLVANLWGVDPLGLGGTRLPIWYSVGVEVAIQLSVILLAPVWLMGLSLLYVDERVRHEGYDIELLAAQRLGAIPDLPQGVSTPLAPAIVASPAPARHAPGPPGSVLGLNDRA